MSSTPDFITLKEALYTIASGSKFSISFVTANTATGAGGQWRHYQNCTCPKRTKAIQKVAKETKEEVVFITKNPNHFENSTRNILLDDDNIKKTHIRLIRKLNGRTVL